MSVRMRVLAGHPTAEELAAVLVALQGAAHTGARAQPSLRRAPWLTAARLEALGAAPAASPAEVPEDPRRQLA